jgi:hypothetical protein
MKQTYKYRLHIRHRYPGLLRNAILAVAVMLALYGLYWSVTTAREGYLLYTEAEERVARANANVELAFAILKGEHPAMTEDGAQVARVTWEKVKLVEGMK